MRRSLNVIYYSHPHKAFPAGNWIHKMSLWCHANLTLMISTFLNQRVFIKIYFMRTQNLWVQYDIIIDITWCHLNSGWYHYWHHLMISFLWTHEKLFARWQIELFMSFCELWWTHSEIKLTSNSLLGIAWLNK